MFRQGFNLVIERLLISGACITMLAWAQLMFQSRYRAASHFRNPLSVAVDGQASRFNLVIERLLISG